MMLNDEEIRELDKLLSAEIADRRIELRRTGNHSFRDEVRHHLDVATDILHKLEEAAETQKQM